MFYRYQNFIPQIGQNSYVHPQASVIGNVIIGNNCYIGPGASLRGDFGMIVIEDGVNVQDNCTLHTFPNQKVWLQKNAHIGHGAVVHGAIIGENSLVGILAVVMDDVSVGNECIIGAHSFVKAGTQYATRSLIVGSPARVIGEVTDKMLAWKTEGTFLYQQLAHTMLMDAEPCEPQVIIFMDTETPKNQNQSVEQPTASYQTWQATKTT